MKRFLAILAIMAAGIMLCPGGTLHLGLRHKDQTMQTAKTEVGVAAWTAKTRTKDGRDNTERLKLAVAARSSAEITHHAPALVVITVSAINHLQDSYQVMRT